MDLSVRERKLCAEDKFVGHTNFCTKLLLQKDRAFSCCVKMGYDQIFIQLKPLLNFLRK